MCGGRALGEALVRMGEALGMTAVTLTPGGSAAQEGELLEASVATDAQHGQHGQQQAGGYASYGGTAAALDGAAEEVEGGGLLGIGGSAGAGGSTAGTEEGGPRYRTTSDD